MLRPGGRLLLTDYCKVGGCSREKSTAAAVLVLFTCLQPQSSLDCSRAPHLQLAFLPLGCSRGPHFQLAFLPCMLCSAGSWLATPPLPLPLPAVAATTTAAATAAAVLLPPLLPSGQLTGPWAVHMASPPPPLLCPQASGEPSEGFAAYIAQRGYDLHTLEV